MREAIGPMTFDEKKLLCISIGLLALWATGGKLHTIDTTTTTIVAIALFFFPKLGIMEWKFAQSNIDWGSIVMFGAGIGLGAVLLKTKAATWLCSSICECILPRNSKRIHFNCCNGCIPYCYPFRLCLCYSSILRDDSNCNLYRYEP